MSETPGGRGHIQGSAFLRSEYQIVIDPARPRGGISSRDLCLQGRLDAGAVGLSPLANLGEVEQLHAVA
jgi:hypothetical protein